MEENTTTANQARRESEVEFVEAAFSPEEAWCEFVSYSNTTENKKNKSSSAEAAAAGGSGVVAVIHRRLVLGEKDESSPVGGGGGGEVNVILSLGLRSEYPETEALQVSLRVSQDTTTGGSRNQYAMLKLVYDAAIPQLQSQCQEVAHSLIGTEAVFSVLNTAEEWIREVWPNLVQQQQQKLQPQPNQRDQQKTPLHPHEGGNCILGRRLIYSHHIISKIKRREILELARHYGLTGYMKIGWPGLIVVEGLDDHCNQFYDEIRKWSWQYLVVRGEMQEQCNNNISDHRRFPTLLQEVSDMSIVAEACRAAKLEALFRTSMKIYQQENLNTLDDTTNQMSTPPPYGALIHVDHMNNPKGYRKWLQKTSQEVGVSIWIRQWNREDYEKSTTTKRPLIIVVLVGHDDEHDQDKNPGKARVGKFLKLWRTSYVDVDSKGQACLERCMQILTEGYLDSTLDNNNNSIGHDEKVMDVWSTIKRNDLLALLESIGSTPWVETIQPLLCGSSLTSSASLE